VRAPDAGVTRRARARGRRGHAHRVVPARGGREAEAPSRRCTRAAPARTAPARRRRRASPPEVGDGGPASVVGARWATGGRTGAAQAISRAGAIRGRTGTDRTGGGGRAAGGCDI
jgi:hypothetical protein